MKADKLSARLYLRNERPRKDGSVPISLRANINGKRVSVPTGISVQPEYWDPVAREIRGKTQAVADANLILSQWMAKTTEIFTDFRFRSESLSPESFKMALLEPESRDSFLAYWEKMIEEEAPLRGDRTVNRYRIHLSRWKMFQPDVQFHELTPALISKFEGWLKTTFALDTNTIASYHKTTKKFIRLALRDDIRLKNPYDRYKVTRAQTEKDALTMEEVDKVLATWRSGALSESEQNVMRYFLFSCFTGMRFSDIEQLEVEDIVGDRINFRPQKTHNTRRRLIIPLNEVSISLIPQVKSGRLFRLVSNQKTNAILREAMDFIGIEKHVTFHAGRHTFATMMLNLGLPAAQVKRWMGIVKWDTFQVYEHMAEEMEEKDKELFGRFRVE